MTAFWILATIAIGLVVLIALTLTLGYRLGVVAGEARAEQVHYAKGYNVGYDAGHVRAETTFRELAEHALARFPTSLGGRAIVKALGGTVPALKRVTLPPRAIETAGSLVTHVRIDSGAVVDGGEGAE